MGRTLLSVEDVSFRRGDTRVLHGISWRVSAGEHWAVLGPNGSGKTTLAMIATGYVPSSGGRVFLVDGYISDVVLPAVREKVGLVSAALTDVMLRHRGRTTGLEAVLSGQYASLGLYRRPTAAELAKARRIIRRFGIEHLADAPFSLMSTGQRQRCLVARCYMAESELVILDEPCAGLDTGAREGLLSGLEQACQKRPDVPQVLVTHHVEEIVPSITHVLLLRDGRTVAQGPKDDVLNEANLEATFGLPLEVIRNNGRFWALPR
ncbi:MAG: ABC transporter ATP-binding protein [Planctomycetota bacterium]